MEHKTSAACQVWQAYERALKGDKMVKSFRVIGAATMFLLLGWTLPADSRQEQQDKPQNQEKQQQQAKSAEKQQQPAKAARQDQPQAKGQQDQPQQQQRQQHWQQDNSARRQQQQTKGQQDQQRQRRHQQDNSAKQQQQLKGQQDQQHQQRQQQDNSPKQQQQQAREQQDQQRQQHQQQGNGPAQQRSPADVRQQQVAWQDDRASNWKSDHRTWQQRGGYRGYRVTDDRFRAYYGQDHEFRIYSLPVMIVGGHRRFQYGGYWFGLVDPWPEYWSSDWYDNDDLYVDYYKDGYYLCDRSHPGDYIAISFYLN
jgi:hypothetical protein